MGRHASPAPEPVDAPEPPSRAHGVAVWVERVLLGLVAGVGTLAVLRWAGMPWATVAWIAVVIAVVVPAAAWLSATVPGRDHDR